MNDGEREPAPRGVTGKAAAHYSALLEAFGAPKKSAIECVRYLESQGLTRGQARNAVYRYRHQHGLAQPRPGHPADRVDGDTGSQPPSE